MAPIQSSLNPEGMAAIAAAEASAEVKMKSLLKTIEDIDFEPTSPAEAESFLKDCLGEVKPGVYLIGTEEEEAKYDKEMAAKYPELYKKDAEPDEEPAEKVNKKKRKRKLDDDDGEVKNAQGDILLDESDTKIDPGRKDLVWDEETDSWISVSEFILSWGKHIDQLYSLPPMEQPPHMMLKLHDYQLEGAAKIQFLCESPFHCAVVGDGMGLGKTLMTIRALYEVRDEPGHSMVVAPRTLCHQWVTAIEGSFEEGHELKALFVENATKMTAHELFAQGVDVVVVSYEQLETAGRQLRALPYAEDLHLNDATGRVKVPRRPNAVFHSRFWRDINLPIKRLVLDEAQLVNKRDGIRHQALKDLFYKAVIILSGTLAHNKWHNFSGIIDFVDSHPWKTHSQFMHSFTARRDEYKVDKPDHASMWLLQRLLQCFTIIRPSSILKLKACNRLPQDFSLDADTLAEVVYLYNKYELVQKINSGGAATSSASSEKGGVGVALGLLVKAQLYGMHPMLVPVDSSRPIKMTGKQPVQSGQGDPGDDNEQDTAQQKPAEEGLNMGVLVERMEADGLEAERREDWLQRVERLADLYNGSPRLRSLVRLYEELCTAYPNRKMLVFSMYLRFLDLFAEALRREHGVVALRYDGSVPNKARPKVQQDFAEGDSSVPLLLTATAGSYGLNITEASIVIQCEPWWNANIEEQAIARAWRQGQTEEVEYRILVSNSPADWHLQNTKEEKTEIIKELMDPLVRLPGEGPAQIPMPYYPHIPLRTYDDEDRVEEEDLDMDIAEEGVQIDMVDALEEEEDPDVDIAEEGMQIDMADS